MAKIIDRFQETYDAGERARVYMAIYFTTMSSPEGYEQYKELVPLLRFGMQHDDEVQRYMKLDPAYKGFDFNPDHLLDLLGGYNNEVREASGQIHTPVTSEGESIFEGGKPGWGEAGLDTFFDKITPGDVGDEVPSGYSIETSYVQQQDEDVIDPETGEVLYTIKAGTPAPLMPIDKIRHDLRMYMPFEEQFGFDPIMMTGAIASVVMLTSSAAMAGSALRFATGSPGPPALVQAMVGGGNVTKASDRSVNTFRALLTAKSFQQAAGIAKLAGNSTPAMLVTTGKWGTRGLSILAAGNLGLQTGFSIFDPVGTGKWWQDATDEAADIWDEIGAQEGVSLPHEAELMTANDMAYVLTGSNDAQAFVTTQQHDYRDQQFSHAVSEGVQAMAAPGEVEVEDAEGVPWYEQSDVNVGETDFDPWWGVKDEDRPQPSPQAAGREGISAGTAEGDYAYGSFQSALDDGGSVGGGYLGEGDIDTVMEFVPSLIEPEQEAPPGPAPHTPFVGEGDGLIGPDYKIPDTSQIPPSPGMPRYDSPRPEDAERFGQDGKYQGQRQYMQPRYNTDDYRREMQRMTPGQIQQFEEAAKAAGLLPESHVPDTMRDPAMAAALEDAMYRANVAGNTWREILTTMGDEKSAADAFDLDEWYNNFVPSSAYMKLDQATIDQTVKTSMREVLGREANQWEIDLFADGMRSDHRENYDQRISSEQQVWNARGRAQEFDGPQGVGTVQEVDEEARFAETFEKQYDVEIDERERWQQMKTDSRNLFGGLSNISNMMGGLG